MKAFLFLLLSCSLCLGQYMPMADPAFLDGAKYEASPNQSAAQYISDSFTRTDSATVGGDWTSETDTASLLAVSGNALVYTDAESPQTAAYVQKTATPSGETWIQFTFSVNTLDIAPNGNRIFLKAFAGSANVFWFKVADLGSTSQAKYYSLVSFNDGGASAENAGGYSPVVAVDTVYTIKIRYKPSTAVGANNGILQVWVNGVQKVNRSTDDTDTLAITHVTFGQMSTSTFTVAPVVTLDSFQWRGDDSF